MKGISRRCSTVLLAKLTSRCRPLGLLGGTALCLGAPSASAAAGNLAGLPSVPPWAWLIGTGLLGAGWLAGRLAQHWRTDLREAQRLALALQGSEDGLFDWDIRSHNMYLSPGWKAMLGYSDTELPNAWPSWQQLLHPDERARIQAQIQACLASNARYLDLEYRMQHRQGHWVDILARARILRDRQGQAWRMVGTHSDISERKRTEVYLFEALERLNKIADNVPGVIYQYRLNPDGSDCLPWASNGLYEIFGISPQQAMQDVSQVRARWHPDDQAATQASIEHSARALTTWVHRFRVNHPDKGLLWAEGRASPERLADGGTLWHGFITDFTQRHELGVAVETERQFLQDIMDGIEDPILVIDANRTVLRMNKAARTWAAIDRPEPSCLKCYQISHHRNRPCGGKNLPCPLQTVLREGRPAKVLHQAESNRAELATRSIEVSVNPLRDSAGTIIGAIHITRDISEHLNLLSSLREKEQAVYYHANHDPLTGLPNRISLGTRLTHLINQTGPNQAGAAVAILDLDRYRQLNEGLGQSAGDDTLCYLARRWQGLLPEHATLARLGADVFALLLPGAQDTADLLELAASLLDRTRQPLHLAANAAVITASIGIALYPTDADNAEDLLQRAEKAMQTAKSRGGNQVAFFDANRAQLASDWFHTENALRQAIANDELFLEYQPQIDMRTGQIVAAEALIRWRRDEQVMPPGQFMPIVETTDLLGPIGQWVIDTACRQAKCWHDSGQPLRVALNVFPAQVTSGSLVADITRALASTGLPAEYLEIEVIESSLLDQPEASVRALRALKRLGVGLALDDFGTGYSSLGYLKHYPFDVLKIDRLFTANLGRDPNDTAIVQATIQLAHHLGLRVLAEGVETVSQFNHLARQGCEQAQGFLLSHPTTAAAIESWQTSGQDLRPASLDAFHTSILLAHGDTARLHTWQSWLTSHGWQVTSAREREHVLQALSTQRIDIIIAGERLQDCSGLALLSELRRGYPHTQRMLVSAASDQATVITAVNRAGITNWLAEPLERATLLQALEQRPATKVDHDLPAESQYPGLDGNGEYRAVAARQQVLAEVAAGFVEIELDADPSDVVRWALARLGKLFDADWVGLCQISPDGQQFSNTYEWCALGIPSRHAQLQALPLHALGPMAARLQHGAILAIPDLTQAPDLPARLDPAYIPTHGALLNIPALLGERLGGCLHLERQQPGRFWQTHDETMLRTMSHMLLRGLQTHAAVASSLS